MTNETQRRLTQEQTVSLINKVQQENWRAYEGGRTLYGEVASASVKIGGTRKRYILFGNTGNNVKITLAYEYTPYHDYAYQDIFDSFVSDPRLTNFYEETIKKVLAQKREKIEDNKEKSLQGVLEIITK